MRSKEKIERYFNPPRSDIELHERLSTLTPAAERVLEAGAKRENVLVYGDYDVDGIAASVVMLDALRTLGVPSNVYLPSRFGEGYGLSLAALERAKLQGYNLVLTVDCGASAVDEVVAARKLGLDIVITDHHEPPQTLPDAIIVNPLLDEAWRTHASHASADGNGDGYYPCGASVALALAQKLFAMKGLDASKLADKHLEIVALATVADVMKLVGINRAIVKHGFDQMLDTTNVGLKSLFAEYNLNASMVPSVEQMQFTVIPALNACGRMFSPRIALKLLTETDESNARRLAAEIRSINTQRRDVQDKVFHEAARDAMNYKESAALVLYGAEWHPGVLGVVAAKVAELFGKPAVILSSAHGDDGTVRGSARSAGAVDLRACIARCSAHIARFGGHKMAAGVVLESDAVGRFRDAFVEAVSGESVACKAGDAGAEAASLLERGIDVETDVASLAVLDVEWIWALEPIGEGNPPPRFLIRDARVENARTVGRDGTTLSAVLANGDTKLRVVGFRMSHLLAALQDGKRYNAVVSAHPDNYNGKRTVRYELKGVADVTRTSRT
jgi:single-stranded-DNA-specific exonuclease